MKKRERDALGKMVMKLSCNKVLEPRKWSNIAFGPKRMNVARWAINVLWIKKGIVLNDQGRVLNLTCTSMFVANGVDSLGAEGGEESLLVS